MNSNAPPPPPTEQDLLNPLWIETWILKTKGGGVRDVKLEELIDEGGLSGKTKRLTFTVGAVAAGREEKFSFVLKTTNPASIATSKSLGLTREAFFYQTFNSSFPIPLPKVVFSHGNTEQGVKTILMEDLSGSWLQAGYLFGANSPHNWRKDLSSITGISDENDRKIETKKLCLKAFSQAACLHREYWNVKSLLSHSWLRGSNWFNGEGKDEWQMAQERVVTSWNIMMEKIKTGSTTLKFPPLLIDCVEASFKKTNWDDFQRRIESSPFTLIHGDFHPANLMWRKKRTEEEPDLKWLDWEVVGLGSGLQDLAQFLISHIYPQERKEWEEELLQNYYLTLTAGNHVDSLAYTFEQCRRDYVNGGVARWVWLLALLLDLVPDSWNQYFIYQLHSFLADHNVTPGNIEMPRV